MTFWSCTFDTTLRGTATDVTVEVRGSILSPGEDAEVEVNEVWLLDDQYRTVRELDSSEYDVVDCRDALVADLEAANDAACNEPDGCFTPEW
jgi:hypothetical protein